MATSVDVQGLMWCEHQTQGEHEGHAVLRRHTSTETSIPVPRLDDDPLTDRHGNQCRRARTGVV